MQSSRSELDAFPGLDKHSPIPLYHQLRTVLQQKIENGELRPSDRLPSEDMLASHYRVSKITVRQALLELDHAGLVKRYQGRGTFISKQPVEQGPRKLSSFSAEMKLRGLQAASKVLDQRVDKADERLASKLEIKEGEHIFVIKRLRMASGEPMGIQTAHLPLVLVPGIESESFAEASLYEVLQRRYNLRPASARETHFATALEKPDSELLNLRCGTPALAAERLTRLANGRLLEYVESIMAADRYRIVLHLTDL